MKTRKWMWCLLSTLLIFFTVSTVAYAELYWESEVVTAGVPEGLAALPEQVRSQLLDQGKPETKTVKCYLTSNASRTDLSNGAIMVIEFDTLTMYQVNVNNKTYTKIDMMSVMDQGMMKEMMEIRVTPTNETKEIAGYKCKKYIVTMMGDKSEYWVSKDVKGYKEYKKMNEKLEKKFRKNPELRQMSILGIASQLDGFPVKTVQSAMGMTTTTTLKKIEKKRLSKDLFKVPKGYKLQELSIPRK